MKRTELQNLQGKYESFVLLTTSRATAQRYAKALNSFMDKFKDRRSPDEFTRMDIEDFILYRRKDGVSGRTINFELTIIRAFWNWMLRQEIVVFNPASKVKKAKEIETERHSLTTEEQERLYATSFATGNPFDPLLVGLVLSTGLRAATLVQLERQHLNVEDGCLHVPAAIMKAGRNHVVPLRPDMIELYLRLPEGRIFDGYASNATGLSYRFNRLLQRSGIGLRGLRLGRRTFATTLLRTGADLRVVQDLLGHRNIVTTSRYLVTADSEQTRAAIDKLPKSRPTPPEDRS